MTIDDVFPEEKNQAIFLLSVKKLVFHIRSISLNNY